MVRLVRWCIFSVAVTLLPIIFNLIKCMVNSNCTLSITYLFCHGELLIISNAIAGSAIGQVIAVRNTRHVPTLIAAGSCVIILSLSSFLYAEMTAAGSTNSYDPHGISITSLVMFILTILAGASCVILAEVSE